MKYLMNIGIVMLAMTCMMFSSCMDGDWDAPDGSTAPFGNNSLEETNVISIKDLKKKYLSGMSKASDTVRITDDIQIKGRVTGNDIGGNIYSEFALQDDSGEGILICVSKGGLFAQLPVGQEVLVSLKDLYIGMYGNMPQIGTPYTNKSGYTFPSRMNYNVWEKKFKLIGTPDPSKVEAETFDVSKMKEVDYIKSKRGKLMKLENVEMVDGGVKQWAPEAEKDAGNGVSRTVKVDGKANSLLVVRSSSYADFAAEIMPKGKVTLTGIFTVYANNPGRYGYTWQILLRDSNDIQTENK